ncbi:cellulase family glycosylhydrolase [uncultured Lutibacter sp.]|uniref:cellulase family glycosylhydrolase n=1 Tax=uncultured Lutibacter sp. TaxID=437739 RepID=UPI00261C31E1|nr:cellulase family glycosylhydrolase [uncultured Lutibacter sp.]
MLVFIRKTIFILVVLFLTTELFSQSSTFVDNDGIMRWKNSNEEVCVFGTNYAVPFAYWDARAPLIGNNHKKAIDEDVYHMARLGIDGFRIHIMESYIADEQGNLKYNLHFELFDYLLFKLKERGIKMYITPMYLGTSIDGSFTKKYGMGVGCLSNEKAFSAQENYLKQFVSHVNPLTGVAYKDDPDIIAFEIVNEPKHWKGAKLVKKYINKMYRAIRSTGCDKPLMYNMTTCVDFIDDVLETKVDGGSFQWYPTGLTSNHEQKGNLLPNVDQYVVPFQNELTKSKRPKFVYEWSPSDTKGAYMYPAMARSFREAGFQFAAHFSYDPLHQAHANVEYKTHFLNLVYTPKKAIGLMIASEVFHSVPLNKSYGRFPKNNKFESFKLSYEDNLAEMLTNKKFLYSNSTKTTPKNPSALEKIAGTGNSSIVQYSGTGAYFLDKIDTGLWRLEILPDAHWVKDPFFVPYTHGEVAVVLSKEQEIDIKLPDLANGFSVEGINKGNSIKLNADGTYFRIKPGVYMLSKQGEHKAWKATDSFQNMKLNEFYMPTIKPKQAYLLHKPIEEISTKTALKLSAKIISEKNIEQVEVILLKKGGGTVFPMKKIDSYNYEAIIPDKYTSKSAMLRYHISYRIGDDFFSYPVGKKDAYLLDRRIYSDDMSLSETKPYRTRVVEASNPIYLFDASLDWEETVKMNRKDDLNIFPSTIPNKTVLRIPLLKANKFNDEYSFRFYCNDKIKFRQPDFSSKTKLSIFGKTSFPKESIIKVQLLMKNGDVFGKEIKQSKELSVASVLLADFKKEKSILLPRPYPKFQVYEIESKTKNKFDINQVEAVQLTINKGETIQKEDLQVEIGWIYLE